MENILYHRMLATVEGQLSPAQYAYRRGRGTEFVLTEITDHINKGLKQGQLAYVVSFDIAGAFDRVDGDAAVL